MDQRSNSAIYFFNISGHPDLKTWLTTSTQLAFHTLHPFLPSAPTPLPTTLTAATTTTVTSPDLDPCDIRNQSVYPDLTQLPWVLTLLTVVYLLVMVLSICGNVLVIVTVWKNSHMHTVTNYYIVNLAVSDLLVSVLVMPLKLLEYTSPCEWNVFGNPLLCPIISYILPIFVFASVLTLVAISLERMVSQRTGDPFVLHRISRAHHRRMIPRSMPQSPRMIPMRR